jgi:hypothetical protein
MALNMDCSSINGGDSTNQLIFTSAAAGTLTSVYLQTGVAVGVSWVNGAGTTLYGFSQLTRENPQASFGPLANGDKLYMRAINVESRVIVDSANV